MRRSLALIDFVVSCVVGCSVAVGFASAAFGSVFDQTERATETVMDPTAPVCADAYVSTYLQTTAQIQTLAAYVKLDQKPPNLKEAVNACAKIESVYQAVVCNVTELQQTARTSDFTDVCAAVRKIYSDTFGSQPQTEPLPVTEVTDASSLVRVTPATLKVKVKDAARLKSLLENPALQYVIEGQIVSLADSLLMEAPVRCTLTRTGAASSAANVVPEETLSAEKIEESYSAGFRNAAVYLKTGTTPLLGFDCTSLTGDGLTVGDFKAALGGLFEITIN